MDSEIALLEKEETSNDFFEVEIVAKIKDELVDGCNSRHRLAVGGRGKGASWSIARTLLVEGIYNPLFIVCVREVQKTIKHSVKKLLEDQIKLLGWSWFYTSTENEIRGLNGTLFVFYGMRDFNADNFKSLEGADRCWVAESQAISRASINILRPTIRKEGSVIWWDFNPRYMTDPVYIDYIKNKDPYATVCWLSWKDNKWFTTALFQEKEADYARNQQEAEHIWEGKLRDEGELYVCPSAFIESAMLNDVQLRGSTDICVGADIAHQGGDEIIFYKRYGLKTVDYYITRKQDALTTAKDLMAFVGDPSIRVNIDNGHVGAAVADILEAQGFTKVHRVNFGGTPIDTDHYYDSATEMYFTMRDILVNHSAEVDIVNDEELFNQLSQRKYKYVTGRRGYEVMKIESKDEYKTHAMRVNSSPDRADALVLTYYDPKTGYDIAEKLDYNIF